MPAHQKAVNRTEHLNQALTDAFNLGAEIVAAHPRATDPRIVLDPVHFQGESTDAIIAPAPLGRLGTRIAEIAALAPEHRPPDLYAKVQGTRAKAGA